MQFNSLKCLFFVLTSSNRDFLSHTLFLKYSCNYLDDPAYRAGENKDRLGLSFLCVSKQKSLTGLTETMTEPHFLENNC